MKRQKKPPGLESLETVVQRVVDDYGAFIARGPAPGAHDDARAFAAHHAAAKSALAHLEHLLKLAGPAAAGEEDGVARAEALLRQARGAMAAPPDDGDEEDQGSDDGASG
ncbi:hypothetical protein [Roseomonas sp. 18066]|uniref:hypothetical protein n=1 Tax=Roseomonas sp. 18066 TaxID=2681412 RepID=UPI001356F2D6|nr:hypothetical protein [Roseomonas sp. 18066]